MAEQIGQVEWRGDEFLRDVEAALSDGIDAAGLAVVGGIRSKINRQGTPTSRSGFLAFARGGSFRRRVQAAAGNSAARRDVALNQSIADLGGFVDPPGGSPRTRTGTLLRSILSKRGRTSEEGVRIGSGVRYADVHEFGSRGPIVPKTKKFLSWVTGGRRIFAKSVTIPARPFIRPGFESSKQAAFEAFVAEAQQTLDRGPVA